MKNAFQELDVLGTLQKKCHFLLQEQELATCLANLQKTVCSLSVELRKVAAFRFEGMFIMAVTMKSTENAKKIARKELSSFTANKMGVTDDDIQPALLKAVRAILE